MIFERFFTPGLAQVAYAIGDQSAGEVVIIDPRRDVQVYRDWAATNEVRIIAALETHIHADFVSGAQELAASDDARVIASGYVSDFGGGELGYDHEAVRDGQTLTVGALEIRTLWTPGHTPEHIAFLAVDRRQPDAPAMLFSGDALFVGDVGRPDLLGDGQTRMLGTMLFETVTRRLRTLPDDTIVYPGHTAGSSCGKKIGDAPSTTIGTERRDNYAFQIDDAETFVQAVLAGMPAPPTYYPILKRINRAGAPLLSSLAPLVVRTTPPTDASEAFVSDALTLDLRSPTEFARDHLPGARFVGYGPNFVTWVGWLAPYEGRLSLIAASAADARAASTDLRRIGVDQPLTAHIVPDGQRPNGRLSGQSLGEMSVEELTRTLTQPTSRLVVLDVRNADEWDAGHIAGAHHLFAGEIAQGGLPELSRDQAIAVICGSGYRSTVAAALLQAQGFRNLTNVIGGMGAWNQAGLPVEAEAA